MSDKSKFALAISRGLGKTNIVLRKYSPEILLGVGLVGFIGAAYLAAKATLKADPIVKEAKEIIESIDGTELTEEMKTVERNRVYKETGIELVKLYAKPVGIGVLSLGSILYSHGIMTRRQVSLIAAYNVMSEAYSAYRERVVNEYGEDVDHDFHLGLKSETVTEKVMDEEGKKSTRKSAVKTPINSRVGVSQYARFFDEASRYWKNDAPTNLVFLRAQQNYANDLLRSRGYLFLNEVYEMLGIPWTPEGQMVGWVLNQGGDDFVDFGIYESKLDRSRAFVNGFEKNILLDFNVDGVVFDRI